MQFSNIDVSLSKGRILSKSEFITLYFGLAVGCCVPVLTLIMLFIPQIEWDVQLIGIMVGMNVCFAMVIALFAFLVIKNKRIIKSIKLWLEDAVEIKAHSKKIGEVRSGVIPDSSIQIEVRFQYDGKVHKKSSTAKVCGLPKGYVDWYNRYADRDVSILYSPQYDEVLILKEL